MKGYKPYTGRKRGWQLIAALVGLLIIAVVAVVLSARAEADKYIRWNVERNRELLTMGCTYAELDKQDKPETAKPKQAEPKPTETTKASAPETAEPKQAEAEPDNIFKIYAYCPCEKCCGSGAAGITATGTTATAGRTIAVDPDVIPLGSVVIIDGNEYIAEDTGGGIKGKTIDLFMNDHSSALAWGIRYMEVVID